MGRMQYVTLNNGLQMPQFGLGVYKMSDEKADAVITKAYDVGYRMIDTAKIYKNERAVGEAIARNHLPREELFVTTKLWNSDHGYENAFKAFDESLEKLGLEYIDLYLIHWPMPMYDEYIETYKALEKIYQDGRTKAIGVCNFNIEHLERLLDACDIIPAVNQVECHPYLQQHELKEYCHKHHIHIEAYSPLMVGGEVLQNEMIHNIAQRYGKTPAQVILRWHLQSDHIVIPKSVTPSRIEENFHVFDFELSANDMEEIASLDCNERKRPDPNEMDQR